MMQAYTKNIEQVILDNFENADKSIRICVAWFTNRRIIEKLVSIKKRKNISIEILVDDNTINEQYFYKPFKAELEKSGIKIIRPITKGFNHNKFSLIDDQLLILGSYNFTYKANQNRESIAISDDLKAVRFFYKSFRFLTEKNYIDENVKLLVKNCEFANKIISAYYPFSRKLLSQIEEKVYIGYCFTHFNGLYNEITYDAGLIFNSRWKYHKALKKYQDKKNNGIYDLEDINNDLSQEFSLPIDKNLISTFKINEINDFNFQSTYESANYNLDRIDFEELADHAQTIDSAVTAFYRSKLKSILDIDELSKVIENNVDLIKEDYIWIQNFAPFFNDDLVLKIYSNISPRISAKLPY